MFCSIAKGGQDLLQSKVLYGWSFSFSGTPDFWNGITDDYTIRYVNADGKAKEVSFGKIDELITYVSKHNIKLPSPGREIVPPCSIALVNYTYQFYETDVILKCRRNISNPWRCQYNAVERGIVEQ